MWKEFILSEQKKEYFISLLDFIHEEYQSKTIFPASEDVYNAFKLCPFDQVKVVILGQDPYHDYNQAHGLAFSVKKGNKLPPSLRNIFKELESDLGIPISSHGDLSSWAKQGILLLNTCLTVEAHKPLSHQNKGWETFTDNVIRKLNLDSIPKVFVLWGNNAKRKIKLIDNKNHMIISSSHPSPLSARHSFFGSRVFSRINQFLKEKGREEIDFHLE